MASEISNGILSKIGEYLLEATIHQAGYLCRFKSNIKDLMKEDDNLKLALDRVQGQVETAERNTEEIEKDVQKWLTDVSNVIEDVQKLEEEIKANKTCLSGCCPNWAWRYRLSRKAEEKRSVMLKLFESGKFTTVSHRANLQDIEIIASGDFETFESTKSTFDQVIEALRDDKISVIGIHGMGGVGKTTLAKQVVKKVKELNIFDNVVWITVSQTPNFKNIQAQMADSLSLKLEEESEDGRARRLSMRLKKEKNILIILDDVWLKIDLKNIGIPFGNDHKVGKILLTTRQTYVCCTMSCELKIPLNVLKEEEGLALLKKNAGIGDDLPTLNALAKEVARKCKGLPLAIVTIGSALKGKAIDDWKLLSQKLKKAKFVNVDDVDTDIYACIKLSYDYLKDEETKSCFLLCSLFPEDFEIPLKELHIFGMGIGLYKDVNSIEEARSQVRVMVNNLKASGLLLDGGKKEFVKMHDLVRDVALWISSEQKKFMSKAGLGLTEWPMEEGLEQYAAISLMGNKLKVLPIGLECPKLEILLLDCYPARPRLKVPDELFVEMKALKVVSLSDGDVSLKSLQFLRNIRSLELHDCILRDISCIGTLNLLEIVSFRGSLFEELPKEFSALGKLRLLDLHRSYELKRISSNVIQRLSQLEELYISGDSIIWEVERTGKEMISNASLFELNSLSHLGKLLLSINDRWIPKDFTFPKLRRYDIIVNPGYRSYFGMVGESVQMGSLRIAAIRSTSLIAFKELHETLQYLELRGLSELSFIWKDWSKHLSLHNLTDVEVSGCPRLRSCIFTVSLAQSLEQLKVLRVSDCQNLTHIINIAEEEERLDDNLVDRTRNEIVLPELQELSLYKLKNLMVFCSENYSSTCPALEKLQVERVSYLSPSFIAEELVKNLRDVTLGDCDQVCDRILAGLKYGSKNLQTLKISNCGVKLLFQELSFPSLKELQLESLYELEALFKFPVHIFNLQNLSTLKLQGCHRLRHIFSTTLARNLLKLKDLTIKDCQELEQIIVEADEKDQISLSLKDHLQPPYFSNLSEIHVEGCPKLKCLFPVTIARNLLKLKDLTIKDCLELEQIIVEADEKDQISMSLKDPLPSPCFSNLQCFSILSIICVERCPKLKSLFPVTIARNLLQLKYLTIDGCLQLKQIIVEEDEKDRISLSLKDPLPCFSNLSNIFVRGCPKLKGLFPVTVARNLLKLTDLTIKGCLQLEQIIVEEDEKDQTSLSLKDHLQLPCFSNLSKIRIEGCHKLKSLFPVTIAQNLLKLKYLTIKDCLELEQIIIEADEKDQMSLSLKDPLPSPCFTNSSEILVEGCPKLKSLFPVAIARNLLKLKYLTIKDCLKLEQIIVEADEKDQMSLSLKDPLPLPCFSNSSEILVEGCPKLKSLFPVAIARNMLQLKYLTIKGCPQLEQIIVEEDEKDRTSLSLKYHLQSPCFSNLSAILVEGCPKLKSLFPVIIARNLLQLNYLTIRNCLELEQIIVEEDEKDRTSLSLKDHLQSPCFSNLLVILVEGCPKLKSLFPVAIAQNLLQLEYLNIKGCLQLEQIIVEDDDVKEFKEFTLRDVWLLTLENLPSLVNLCSVDYHFVFPSLTNLTVRNCPKMTTSISVTQNGTVHVHDKPEAPQEDVIAESPAQSTMEIYCKSTDEIQRTLPPYIGN